MNGEKTSPGWRKEARRAFLLLLAAAVPAIGAALMHPKRPAWVHENVPALSSPEAGDEIALETAREWGSRILWVDTRTRRDFERGHIPGAVLLNEDEWERQLDSFLDAWKRDSKVMVYCGSPQCDSSRAVAERLRNEVGLDNVHVLKGGFEAWSAQKK